MKSVSAFEAKLLRSTRAMMHRVSQEQAVKFAKSRHPTPACLGADAVALLQDTLAKGTTLFLAHSAWDRQRYLRGDTARVGRLWERTPPTELGLTFSANTLAFLRWTTADACNARAPELVGEPTLGDWLTAFLAYRLYRFTSVQMPMLATKLVSNNALCRLMFPGDFAKVKPGTVAWTSWAQPTAAWIFEAFESALVENWFDIENEKRFWEDRKKMLETAAGQAFALDGLLSALDQTQRWDLARFLLRLASKLLLAGQPTPQRWYGSVKLDGLTLAERTNLYRAALVLMKYIERLGEWTQRTRTVGYLDEGYAAAQLWKADWERFNGDEILRQAARLLFEIEPLKPRETT